MRDKVEAEIEAFLKRAWHDPEAYAEAIQATLAQERLVHFIKMLWPILEPGRQFIDGWAVHAICDHLEAVTAGQIKRLLINVPPGTMKSLTTNVFWPAWEWGPMNRPDLRFISASYAENLTVRDNRRCRALIKSDPYQRCWGDRFKLAQEQNAKTRFDTDKTGFKIATSVSGLGTGERGDRFIVDDPNNVKESESEAKREATLQWFTEVVPTRINDPEESAIVVIMQRVHQRDVSGLVLRELDYEHLCLPMEFERARKCFTSIGFEDPRTEEGQLLWPQRFSRKYLEEDLKPTLRSWGGEYAVAGQLRQDPVPRGGGMFKRDDFQVLDSVPRDVVRWVRGWDLAATKDGHGARTVGLKMGRTKAGLYVVSDAVYGRWSAHEVRAQMRAAAELDGQSVQQDVPQDPGQAGKAQKADVAANLAGHDVTFSPESGSKEDRARPLAAQCGAGNLAIVRGSWNEAFLDEACTFPMGATKDFVDAASRAFANLTMKRDEMIGLAPILIQ